jgi:hypothetical protein
LANFFEKTKSSESVDVTGQGEPVVFLLLSCCILSTFSPEYQVRIAQCNKERNVERKKSFFLSAESMLIVLCLLPFTSLTSLAAIVPNNLEKTNRGPEGVTVHTPASFIVVFLNSSSSSLTEENVRQAEPAGSGEPNHIQQVHESEVSGHSRCRLVDVSCCVLLFSFSRAQLGKRNPKPLNHSLYLHTEEESNFFSPLFLLFIFLGVVVDNHRHHLRVKLEESEKFVRE